MRQAVYTGERTIRVVEGVRSRPAPARYGSTSHTPESVGPTFTSCTATWTPASVSPRGARARDVGTVAAFGAGGDGVGRRGSSDRAARPGPAALPDLPRGPRPHLPQPHVPRHRLGRLHAGALERPGRTWSGFRRMSSWRTLRWSSRPRSRCTTCAGRTSARANERRRRRRTHRSAHRPRRPAGRRRRARRRARRVPARSRRPRSGLPTADPATPDGAGNEWTGGERRRRGLRGVRRGRPA